MKKAILAGTMLALMAVVAEAQVTIDYTRRTRNSNLNVTFSTGYYSYYGYGGFGGFGGGSGGFSGFGAYGGFGYPGYFSSYQGGLGVPVNGMPMTAPYPMYPSDGAFYAGGGTYSYGGLPGLYGGGAYRSPYWRPPVSDYYPGPIPTSAASDRMNELASSKEIEVGRLRFKAGDYKGAVDDFRLAVVSNTSNAAAQAYFAVALIVLGDARNADKALRNAADRAPFGRIDFSDLFPNDKERVRITSALGKVSGDGALAAAYALSVMGEGGPLRKLAEKDPVAKKLVP